MLWKTNPLVYILRNQTSMRHTVDSNITYLMCIIKSHQKSLRDHQLPANVITCINIYISTPRS